MSSDEQLSPRFNDRDEDEYQETTHEIRQEPSTKYQKIRTRLVPALNLTFFIGLVIINALAAMGKINNIATGKVSDEYFTAITPAGWAFSIWGLIYTFVALVIVINVVQSLILGRNNRLINEKISYWLTINFVLNMAWMLFWQYSARGNKGLLWMTVVCMLGILLSLIIMYVRVNVNYLEPSKVNGVLSLTDSDSGILSKILTWKNVPCNTWEFWIIQPMISLYMGWICVATVANMSVCLTYNLSKGTGEDFVYEGTLWGISHAVWSSVMHAVIVCLGLIFLHKKRDFYLSGVFVWALFAIADQHKEETEVSRTAILGACILLFFTIYTVVLTLSKYVQFHSGWKGTWNHIVTSVKKTFTWKKSHPNQD